MSQRQPELLIATRNPGKVREFQELFRDLPYRLLSLDEVGVTGEVEETGQSFRENAWLKASEYSKLSGLLTLSDDSGLEVDALGGEPGIHSARYGGDASFSDQDRVWGGVKNSLKLTATRFDRQKQADVRNRQRRLAGQCSLETNIRFREDMLFFIRRPQHAEITVLMPQCDCR